MSAWGIIANQCLRYGYQPSSLVNRRVQLDTWLNSTSETAAVEVSPGTEHRTSTGGNKGAQASERTNMY